MGLFPPRSLADRQKWSRERPWLAGAYFGFAMSVVFGVITALRGGASVALALFVVMWPVSSVTFAVLAKRRFGERNDADQQPGPTLQRLWSRASDRFLVWTLILGFVSAAVSVISLVLPDRSLWDLLTLGCGAFLTATAAVERRHRVRP